MMPKRIQRRRTKGWKMPPNTVYVGRPTIFGNPFIVCAGGWTREEALDLFRRLLKSSLGIPTNRPSKVCRGEELPLPTHYGYIPAERVAELRGKDLACWCRLDQPCHADVLLEIANV